MLCVLVGPALSAHWTVMVPYCISLALSFKLHFPLLIMSFPQYFSVQSLEFDCPDHLLAAGHVLRHWPT